MGIFSQNVNYVKWPLESEVENEEWVFNKVFMWRYCHSSVVINSRRWQNPSLRLLYR